MIEPEVKVELPKIEESVKVEETENTPEQTENVQEETVEVLEEKPKRKINKIETVD